MNNCYEILAPLLVLNLVAAQNHTSSHPYTAVADSHDAKEPLEPITHNLPPGRGEGQDVDTNSEWSVRNMMNAVTAVRCGANKNSISRQFNVRLSALNSYLNDVKKFANLCHVVQQFDLPATSSKKCTQDQLHTEGAVSTSAQKQVPLLAVPEKRHRLALKKAMPSASRINRTITSGIERTNSLNTQSHSTLAVTEPLAQPSSGHQQAASSQQQEQRSVQQLHSMRLESGYLLNPECSSRQSFFSEYPQQQVYTTQLTPIQQRYSISEHRPTRQHPVQNMQQIGIGNFYQQREPSQWELEAGNIQVPELPDSQRPDSQNLRRQRFQNHQYLRSGDTQQQNEYHCSQPLGIAGQLNSESFPESPTSSYLSLHEAFPPNYSPQNQPSWQTVLPSFLSEFGSIYSNLPRPQYGQPLPIPVQSQPVEIPTFPDYQQLVSRNLKEQGFQNQRHSQSLQIQQQQQQGNANFRSLQTGIAGQLDPRQELSQHEVSSSRLNTQHGQIFPSPAQLRETEIPSSSGRKRPASRNLRQEGIQSHRHLKSGNTQPQMLHQERKRKKQSERVEQLDSGSLLRHPISKFSMHHQPVADAMENPNTSQDSEVSGSTAHASSWSRNYDGSMRLPYSLPDSGYTSAESIAQPMQHHHHHHYYILKSDNSPESIFSEPACMQRLAERISQQSSSLVSCSNQFRIFELSNLGSNLSNSVEGISRRTGFHPAPRSWLHQQSSNEENVLERSALSNLNTRSCGPHRTQIPRNTRINVSHALNDTMQVKGRKVILPFIKTEKPEIEIIFEKVSSKDVPSVDLTEDTDGEAENDNLETRGTKTGTGTGTLVQEATEENVDTQLQTIYADSYNSEIRNVPDIPQPENSILTNEFDQEEDLLGSSYLTDSNDNSSPAAKMPSIKLPSFLFASSQEVVGNMPSYENYGISERKAASYPGISAGAVQNLLFTSNVYPGNLMTPRSILEREISSPRKQLLPYTRIPATYQDSLSSKYNFDGQQMKSIQGVSHTGESVRLPNVVQPEIPLLPHSSHNAREQMRSRKFTTGKKTPANLTNDYRGVQEPHSLKRRKQSQVASEMSPDSGSPLPRTSRTKASEFNFNPNSISLFPNGSICLTLKNFLKTTCLMKSAKIRNRKRTKSAAEQEKNKQTTTLRPIVPALHCNTISGCGSTSNESESNNSKMLQLNTTKFMPSADSEQLTGLNMTELDSLETTEAQKTPKRRPTSEDEQLAMIEDIIRPFLGDSFQESVVASAGVTPSCSTAVQEGENRSSDAFVLSTTPPALLTDPEVAKPESKPVSAKSRMNEPEAEPGSTESGIVGPEAKPGNVGLGTPESETEPISAECESVEPATESGTAKVTSGESEGNRRSTEEGNVLSLDELLERVKNEKIKDKDLKGVRSVRWNINDMASAYYDCKYRSAQKTKTANLYSVPESTLRGWLTKGLDDVVHQLARLEAFQRKLANKTTNESSVSPQ